MYFSLILHRSNCRQQVNPEDAKEPYGFLRSVRKKIWWNQHNDGKKTEDHHSTTEVTDEHDNDTPRSSSPCLCRHDSSTSGISTGCDNDDSDRLTLRKKPKDPITNEQGTSGSGHPKDNLPILGPIIYQPSEEFMLMARDSHLPLFDIDVVRKQKHGILEPLDLSHHHKKRTPKRKRKKKQSRRRDKDDEEDELECKVEVQQESYA